MRQDAFEFQDAAEPPEKMGWCEAAALISKASLGGPVAMIVDAHLGELKAINDRTKAICRGYFLPKEIELLYASSDAGCVEFIANAALSHCDKIGAMLMKLSGQVPVLFFKPAPPGSPYNRSRLWRPPSDSSEDWKLAQS